MTTDKVTTDKIKQKNNQIKKRTEDKESTKDEKRMENGKRIKGENKVGTNKKCSSDESLTNRCSDDKAKTDREKLKSLIKKYITNKCSLRIVCSKPVKKENTPNKIELKSFESKDSIFYQREFLENNKAFHKNYSPDELLKKIDELLRTYRQLFIQSEATEHQIIISKKGKVSIKTKEITKKLKSNSHNRTKNKPLLPGEYHDFLYHLGIINEGGDLKKKHIGKFNQINKFLELLTPMISKLQENSKAPLKIVDFGSGKAYLTFAVYWYFKVEKKQSVEVVGVDLKDDMIKLCNELAEKLDYQDLNFTHGSIDSYNELNGVDLIISLHACNTATDDAIIKAIKSNIRGIFLAPCCQQEFLKTIENKELDFLLKHGILKEKFSSLLTDAFRGEVLEAFGYDVNIFEFIGGEHTPKNIAIKGIKEKNNITSSLGDKELLNKICGQFNLNSYLMNKLQ